MVVGPRASSAPDFGVESYLEVVKEPPPTPLTVDPNEGLAPDPTTEWYPDGETAELSKLVDRRSRPPAFDWTVFAVGGVGLLLLLGGLLLRW